jgi:hypothetical protein
MDAAAGIALGVFLLGVTFAGGRLSARVDALEEGRREMKTTIDAMFEALREIQRAVKGDHV